MAQPAVGQTTAQRGPDSAGTGAPDSQALARVVQRIVEAVRPQRIVLFGSAARGQMRPDSDVDLLVVVSEGMHPRRTAQLLYRRGFDAPFSIDLVVATTDMLDRYGDSPGLVYREALRGGRELYAA